MSDQSAKSYTSYAFSIPVDDELALNSMFSIEFNVNSRYCITPLELVR